MADPPTKRRRTGGIKQRLAAMKREDHVDNSGSDASELAQSFLKKWAWGHLSPQDVQEYSAKACRDFRSMKIEPPTELDFFAKLGTSGSHKYLGLCVYFCDTCSSIDFWKLCCPSFSNVCCQCLLVLLAKEQDAQRDLGESE